MVIEELFKMFSVFHESVPWSN